jgi:hypothetical protein
MQALNRLADALTQVCHAHVLAEKWLIAPSLRVGYQWLDSVAFGGQPVLNARVNTLKGLAIDLASPVLAERNLTVASARCGAMVVDRIIGQLRHEGHACLSRLSSGKGIAQAFHTTIDSLRLAGLTGADLAARHFEDSQRGEALRQVLDAYLDQLHASQVIDYAQLLEIAITQLETTRDALPADAMLLVPQDAALNHLEERLMAAIPGEKLRRLAVDEPASRESSAETDTELLCWILQPSEAPPPTTRKTVQIVQAIGEVNEVRQIFRQCLAGGTRLDDVEVLHMCYPGRGGVQESAPPNSCAYTGRLSAGRITDGPLPTAGAILGSRWREVSMWCGMCHPGRHGVREGDPP